MAVVDVRVRNDVHQLAGLESADLRHHVDQHRVLHHVPVVRRQHILTALVQNGVERIARHVEGHGVGAGIERHFMQVGKIVEVRQDAPRGRIMLQVIEHAIHLIEHPLFILVLHAELVAVGLADAAALVRPRVPDVGGEVVDVIAFFLPDPQKLVHRALPIGAAQREDGEFPLQVVAVDDAEFLDRVRRGPVLPARTHGKLRVPHAVFQNVLAVPAKNLIGIAHILTSRDRCFFYLTTAGGQLSLLFSFFRKIRLFLHFAPKKHTSHTLVSQFLEKIAMLGSNDKICRKRS